MEASPDDGYFNRSPRSPEFLRGVVCSVGKQTERMELSEAESMPLEWTDEKHIQYLKSMEASFVNQLYDSMEQPCWLSDKENLSVAQSRRHDKCFKVQRDGCWKKINFEGPCSQSNTSAKSHVFLKSPWTRHFRSISGRLGLAVSSDLGKIASSSNHPTRAKGKMAITGFPDMKSKQHHAYVTYILNQALISNNAEASDQNFADDDLGVMDQNGASTAKRTKALGTDSLWNDQVVPFSEAAPSRDNTG